MTTFFSCERCDYAGCEKKASYKQLAERTVGKCRKRRILHGRTIWQKVGRSQKIDKNSAYTPAVKVACIGVARIFSRRGAKVVKFVLSNSKPRKQPFLLRFFKSRRKSPCHLFRRPWLLGCFLKSRVTAVKTYVHNGSRCVNVVDRGWVVASFVLVKP